MHNRAQNVLHWREDELFLILLRQFKRLLADHDVDLSDAELRGLADQMALRQVDETVGSRVRAALVAIIDESLQVLRGWHLTYAESLATGMDQLPGWETTADFLQMANEKGNAELRISTGAALLTALGDTRHADELLACYRHGMHDAEDVDAVIARRALAFAAGVPVEAEDWLNQIKSWIAHKNRATD